MDKPRHVKGSRRAQPNSPEVGTMLIFSSVGGENQYKNRKENPKQENTQQNTLAHQNAMLSTKAYAKQIAQLILINSTDFHKEDNKTKELLAVVARMRNSHIQAQKTSNQLI